MTAFLSSVSTGLLLYIPASRVWLQPLLLTFDCLFLTLAVNKCKNISSMDAGKRKQQLKVPPILS